MSKKNFFMDQLGLTYLEARTDGKSSIEACQVVRDRFNKPDLRDTTIRSYASKVGQHGRKQTERKTPNEDKVLLERRIRVYSGLWEKLEAEAVKKNVGLSQLLNSILIKHYARNR